MKFLRVILALVFAATVYAQTPNCQINFGPWTDVNSSPPSDNRVTQCTYWVMTYQVTGFTAVSLRFESATGANTPGAFGAYSGTVSSGVNPSISVVCSTVTNCTATFTGAVGWYRVALNSFTGSGTIRGTLQGYKTGYTLGGATAPGSSGCPGTAATPCVVDGVTASGSPPTTAPVLIAGQDGTNIETLKTDTGGRVQPAGLATAQADGASNTPTVPVAGAVASTQPIYPYLYNGSTWDRQFGCTNVAPITFTAASGSLQIVALTSLQSIRICLITLASDTATNITFQNGTGSNCGTGTTTLAGPFQNVLTISMPFYDGAFRVPVSNAFCINSSATATIGGMVTYAKF